MATVAFVDSPGFFVLLCLKSFDTFVFILCVRGEGWSAEDSVMGVGALLPRESRRAVSPTSLVVSKVCVFRVVRSVVGTRCDAQVADAETDPEKGGLP